MHLFLVKLYCVSQMVPFDPEHVLIHVAYLNNVRFNSLMDLHRDHPSDLTP